MKNMNRLIRIYGLNRRHCLHELTGSMTFVSSEMYVLRYRLVEIHVRIQRWTKRDITIPRLRVITLQNDKVKDCDRHPPQYV